MQAEGLHSSAFAFSSGAWALHLHLTCIESFISYESGRGGGHFVICVPGLTTPGLASPAKSIRCTLDRAISDSPIHPPIRGVSVDKAARTTTTVAQYSQSSDGRLRRSYQAAPWPGAGDAPSPG